MKPSFKATISSLRQQKKSLPWDVDLRLTLKTQLRVCLSVIDSVSSDADSTHPMLASSGESFLELCSAIIAKLQPILDIMDHLPSSLKAQCGKPSSMDILKPKKPSVASDGNPVPSTGSLISQEFHHFRVIQKAAHSLYAAFETACNAHSVHDVYLSLQPHFNGNLTLVSFNIAFENPQTSGRMAWIDVESTMKSVESLLPTSPSAVLETPLTNRKREGESESLQCSYPVRKCVQFQTFIQPIQALPSHIPQGPAGTIASLHLQRNFCAVLERSFLRPECTSCLGVLGNSDACKHLAYINTDGHQAPSPSLSEFIASSKADLTGGLGLYERISIGQKPSYGCPLLPCDAVALQSLAQRECPILWRSFKPSSTTTRSILHSHFDSSIEQLWIYKKGGTAGFADYFTAQRLVDLAGRRTTKDFRDIIKECLYCNFGHDNDFTSPSLQEAFYRGVITAGEVGKTLPKTAD
ncbi:hypothetical protein N7493_011387 [Penicillium malachiteum]|uniref:Uncharacterized protein n=1 Tax=Penicillium malachiteum TaxID=1324776 RepID=A0AAD6HC59_9EURO|nr:hypothetical protein N7493_011387 [Penicillium malachiteum]